MYYIYRNMQKTTILRPSLAWLLLIYLLLLSTSSFCQKTNISDSLKCTQYLDTLTNRQLYRFPEKDATYKGGTDGFSNYINRNLTYDRSHVEHQTILIFSFIVEADGSVSHVILKYHPHGVTNEIIEKTINVLNRLPKLSPATCGAQKVATRQDQPIIFMPKNN
jgi:hypothetical protein